MKRVIYYVIWANSEENDNGIFHYSEGSQTESKARAIALHRREKLGSEGHVAIEKHFEKYECNEWRIDHGAGGSVHIDYF